MKKGLGSIQYQCNLNCEVVSLCFTPKIRHDDGGCHAGEFKLQMWKIHI